MRGLVFGLIACGVFLLGLLVAATDAQADTMLTTGSGSAVSSTDLSATFDSINTNGIDLSAYSEGGLNVTVPDSSYVGFDFFGTGNTTELHYGSGGNDSFVTITGTSGEIFSGVEFLYGAGWSVT